MSKSFFDVPYEEQVIFLQKQCEPKNDIQRSYLQYCCQMYFVRKKLFLLLNMASILLGPFLVFFYYLKGLTLKSKEKIDAVADFKRMPEILPKELAEEYDVDYEVAMQGGMLTFNDIEYIVGNFIKYWYAPYFVVKSVIKLSIYSYTIYTYSPRSIIVHSESAFTSSAMTDYCHYRNVKHIDVLHGEKVFYIRDSYFHFDECYVWNEYYVSLFKQMRAEPSQFRVSVPSSMKINSILYENPNLFANYKYFLQGCVEAELVQIKESMRFVLAEGKTIKYRPHPMYSDMKMVERIFGKESIEYPKEVSILASISNMDVAVSSYSTVLNQAIHAGKAILLDDVTFKTQYDKLKNLKYILAIQKYPVLSEKLN
ncbi:hypothetical protein [Parabacteroides sp.]|uniref:hypothetical protein n=1 Tax=Parabacteroides sp. TaxID=1869337 RepID=UPI00257E856A|nr:hypothetical protein [Parabacteroides sp.]